MKKHEKTEFDDTLKSDPVVSAVQTVAGQLRDLAARLTQSADRLDQAAARIKGVTGAARKLALRDVCGLVRLSGDGAHSTSQGCHDMARSIENFLGGT
jgi:hypothetical protein